ncbi:DUF1543 domain-containing protein [Marivirga salinae]|uniref:DUF1543 domain-containing protein n=1 Tax=Marivirga salinarum TaxID=3059078 RepID=A0AA49GDT1_9BACT|nr:DUF1543 domain-containing protein [Marivirga sp. BDSF4-3]WKK76108.2 DUF1543 domain-containing protein [Marivirga sp. BDSF4-3]
MNSLKLYAVVLGGAAEKSNTELHDVVFAVGENIEDCYFQLLDKWFGLPEKMHVDSYMELDVVDGYEISLQKEKSKEKDIKLFFINLGAYKEGDFMEHHANTFLVGKLATEIKKRAKEKLLNGYDQVHKDDLYEVDDMIAIEELDGYHVHLNITDKKENLKPVNGYHVLPKKVVKDFLEQK